MEWVETTAKTVDDARARALDLLGVDNADAEIEVIDEGKTGLFGRMKTEARVRARIRPKAPPAREERRQRRGGGGKGRGGDNRQRGGKSGGGNNRNRNQGGSGGGGRNKSDSGDGGGEGQGGRNNNNRGGGRNRGGGGGNNRGDSNRGDSNRGDSNRGESKGGRNEGNRNRNDRSDRDRDNRNRSDRDRSDRDRNDRDRGRSDSKTDDDRSQSEGRSERSRGNDRGGRSNAERGGDGRRQSRDSGRNEPDVDTASAVEATEGVDTSSIAGAAAVGAAAAATTRGGPSNRDTQQDSERAAEAASVEGAQEKDMDEEFPIEEQSDTMADFVAGLSEIFDEASSVSMSDDGETLEAQIDGGDVGLMIGPSGATLSAIEELTRTTMQRAAAGRRYRRLRVDVDGYRARRREALVRFVTDLAEEVASSGDRKVLESMNSVDRKTVHDTVGDIDGVSTLSEGNDPRRYVVIVPDED